jgi:hypothetical protein
MTLSLDPDVATLIERHRQATGRSLRATVNELLRLGLVAAAKPFEVKPRALGLLPGMSYDNVGELLESLDRLEGK